MYYRSQRYRTCDYVGWYVRDLEDGVALPYSGSAHQITQNWVDYVVGMIGQTGTPLRSKRS